MAEIRIYPTGDNTIGANFTVVPTSPTTKFDKVDEVTADDNTTYIGHSNTTASSADFNMGDLTGYAGTITKVTVFMRMGNYTVSNQGNSTFNARVNGANGSSLVLYTNNGYVNYTQDWTTNPSTGVAWTWANINAMTAGFRVAEQTTKFMSRFTQVHVIVTYIAPFTTIQGCTIQGCTIS